MGEIFYNKIKRTLKRSNISEARFDTIVSEIDALMHQVVLAESILVDTWVIDTIPEIRIDLHNYSSLYWSEDSNSYIIRFFSSYYDLISAIESDYEGFLK